MAVNIDRLNQRYQALRNERSPWDAAWRELAEHFLPTKFRADSACGGHKPEILNKRIVDTTGILDMRTLAAGMQGGMTSPVRPWFRLTLEDGCAHRGAAGAWLDDVTVRMQALLHQSNFYNASHSLYADLGTFGPGLLIETADWNGLHFTLVPAGEYVLDVDDRGTVDTFMYRLRMSARQIVRQFGKNNVPDAVKTAADSPAATAFFDVIHAVFPRTDRICGRLDAANMPYASVCWLGPGSHGGKARVLRESGFRDFPAFAPRWDAVGNDKYGRSPAMDVLSDCRMLQQMGLTTLKALHKAVDPPLAVPVGLRSEGVDLTPGGLNFLDFTSPESGKIEAVQHIQPQIIEAAELKIRAVQQKIHDGLYADLFKMLMLNDRRTLTATEIDAREREKLSMLGPVVERLDKELHSPLILRTFRLMEQFDALPPAPPGMRGAPLRVEFTSVLAQAQRMASTSPIDQTVAFVAGMAPMRPEITDILDLDRTVRAYADALGAPAAMLRSAQDVRAIRQARAEAQARAGQQAQTQQVVEQVARLSDAARNLGQTPLGADGQTAMSAIVGGLGSL